MLKKSIFTITLALFLAVNTYASGFVFSSGNYAGGDESQYVSLEAQRDQLLANPNLTNEQRAKIVDKYERAVRSTIDVSSSRSSARAVNYVPKILDVPFCPQEESYYCGPATVRQTYYYLNWEIYGVWTAPSQDTIAGLIGTTSTSGTDLEMMKNYLNTEFELDYYVQWWWSSVWSMTDSVFYTICIDNRPAILHISVDSIENSDWKFPTGGHYVNVVGYDSTFTRFNIVAPYYEGHYISDGAYTVSEDDIFDYHVRMAY